MTELQPSPSGYRGQDEAPGLPTCSPNTFVKSYPNTTHGHPVETSKYKGVGTYSQDSSYLLQPQQQPQQQQQQQQHQQPYHHHQQPHHHHHYQNQNNNKQQQQSASRASSPSEHNYRKTDRRTSENENNVGDNGEKKSKTIAGYNEGYKKNTPGYKNDSGYSESIGFESFSLPLNERNEVSPPPTPPARDASSLKGVCYGPGHEKYPSWPSAPERCPDDDINSIGQSGSHRSKSWTDHTNYPKEKPAQYTRPLAKRPNAAFTQQLKTVMERCEKIPAETFESRGSRSSLEDEQPRLWPRVDREGNPLGDTEYVVPSPPEREQQQPSQTLSHADLEAYVRSYQDPQVTEVDIYRETTLTQAGLEEYTRVQHSQQASYAQSEGYHSYVSSVDSTTNTPFLDRLRRDSEAVSQRAPPSWEEASREGRDSVVTTSSGGSASSSETLKWHGSMSDVSVSSGHPPRQVSNSNAWPHGSMSDVSSVNGVIGVQKPENDHEKWQGSMNNVSSSMMNNSAKSTHRHSNDIKWQENKWQMAMNDNNSMQMSSRTTLPAVISHCASVNDVCQAITDRESKWLESSIDDESSHERGKGIQRGWESCLNVDQARYNQNSRLTPHSPTSHSQQQLQQHNIPDADEWNPLHGSMSDVSQVNTSIHGNSKQLIAHSARVQTPQRHHSESVLYLDRERSQRKLYPISTTQPQESGQSSRISPVSPQQGHLSVAERINELEKHQQQQMRYTYLDPDKRHRVSDPTLKAIQKKALLSFYERHHQSSWRSEPQLAQDTSPTTQSPPPQPPPRPRPPSSRRASSASDYASGTWREKTNRMHNNKPPSPKHQHSNSCGSLSTDLLGPVIVGPAISIDDWVPERPPKKPHLRAVYNDRVPSPDLPPPSPPNVTENEVVNCDDPLPPPPPPLTELNDRTIELSKDVGQHDDMKRHCRSQQIERSSTRRSKHNKRSDKSIPASTSTQYVNKSHVNDNNFIRGSALKPIESECTNDNSVAAGYATHRMIATGRSSLRYPSADKLMMNGRVSLSKRNPDERNVSRPPARLPDLVSQRYSDSGNQRPAPQVPVESRVIRQESMRVESTRMDISGLSKSGDSRLEHCLGQRPQPQVPKNNNGIDTSAPYASPSIQSTRPIYSELTESSKYLKYSENHGYSVGTSVKTSYEANAKLLAESNPQKYHEPPKYGSNHHQRHMDQSLQRNYFVLPPKYMDNPKQMPQPQCPDRYASSPGSPPPPPLAPRQNTPGRKSLPAPPRPAPPPQQLQGSQSKASYLAYKRERGAPDSEGSYKRTMSPTARLEDWPPSRDREDPVLLRVTPHHQHQHHQLHHNNHNYHDLPKSHSVDALHHRIEERTNAHSVEVIGKLSHELGKKLQASDTRPRSENNNNVINKNDCHEDRIHHQHHQESIIQRQIEKRLDYSDRIASDSLEVLKDRNRQSERERLKLAASSEQVGQSRHHLGTENKSGLENFYRDRSATIEMTSRNVELLNRRNAQPDKRHSATTSTLTDFDRTSNESIENANNRPSFVDKPLQTSTTSPKFVKIHENGDSPTVRSFGAVPRRSGSCSSSSSSSTRSSLERGVTHSRISPSKTFSIDSSIRNENRTSLPEIENVKRSSNSSSPRSKVSSPAQTENSWTKFGCSQACTLINSRLRRTSSSDSRSSSMSSTSKISSPSSSSASPRYSPVDNNKTSPCVSPQPGIEGLTLVQRSEIVLRVNTATIDAASQTEIIDEDESISSKDLEKHQVLPLTRRKLPEEIECDELSRDLVNQLGPHDKLAPILVPAPEHKKPTDYVSGLFRVETMLKPRLSRPVSLTDTGSSSSSPENSVDDRKNETMLATPSSAAPSATIDVNSSLSPTSAYFTTSEGKARFLTRYSQDMTNNDEVSCANACNGNESIDDADLKRKKEELVLRLDRKVVVLRAEQEAVREEGEINETLGTKVSSRITAIARPTEASKYRLHVEEIGKITSLLLGLSGRLARAENALHGMATDHPERKCLEGKRDKLLEQLEEAKILKCNIDKRSVNVSAMLSKYLNDEEFADYQHFISMKTKLIMDGREIQDKVKLGEEQLAALKEAIG